MSVYLLENFGFLDVGVCMSIYIFRKLSITLIQLNSTKKLWINNGGIEFYVFPFVLFDLSVLLWFWKAGKDANTLIENTEENSKQTVQKEAEVQEALTALQSRLGSIGNLVHDSVPVDNNEVCLRSSCSSELACPCAGQYFQWNVTFFRIIMPLYGHGERRGWSQSWRIMWILLSFSELRI